MKVNMSYLVLLACAVGSPTETFALPSSPYTEGLENTTESITQGATAGVTDGTTEGITDATTEGTTERFTETTTDSTTQGPTSTVERTTQTATESTTGTTWPSTTAAPCATGFNGKMAHRSDCTRYIICKDYLETVFDCLEGYIYYEPFDACLPGNVKTCTLYRI
ncbi:uncharacterized protein LOC128743887 [Sabethes cyaneus]|uniref:uncharacterized protein LOC128743887 n=1 Tax=Sabethes cyaneus TaxID=53552 RepID=UPI00237D6BF4|nr:uncharacterized protein LOC128743887 [Sabethes cyaneus]